MLRTSINSKFRIQLDVALFLIAFNTIWESPLMMILERPNFKHIKSPSCRTLSSVKLLVVSLIDLALLAIQNPESMLMMQPMPTLPGLPREVPSKFNLDQP